MIDWLKERLREQSTWSAVGMMLTAVGMQWLAGASEILCMFVFYGIGVYEFVRREKP